MSPAYSRTAAPGAVIEQFPVRQRQCPRRDLDGLASSLLDLCGTYESGLHRLLVMQRHLERVRRGDAVSPEAVLLLQEISRQLEGVMDGCGGLDARLRTATQQLDAIRHDVEP